MNICGYNDFSVRIPHSEGLFFWVREHHLSRQFRKKKSTNISLIIDASYSTNRGPKFLKNYIHDKWRLYKGEFMNGKKNYLKILH